MIITPHQIWSYLPKHDKQEMLQVMSRDFSFFSKEERDALKNLLTACEDRYIKELPHLTEEMKGLIREGRKIAAIKLYRETYLPVPALLDAKNVADAYKDTVLLEGFEK